MSMLGVLQNLKPLLKVRNVAEKAAIDDKIFRLHYRITALILLGCCAFVTAYSIFGDPIECLGTYTGGKRKVVNTYCYLGYTYTIPGIKNNNGMHDGIGTHTDQSQKKFHNYYRWVPLFLFLQGMCFYFPYWLWKCFENKKLNHLTKGLRGPVVTVDSEHKKRLTELAQYAADSLHTHNPFALMYYFCQILNFINVIANVYFMNKFLNGEFIQYGFDVLNLTDKNQENRTDPMISVFPRITKCDFHKIGFSGSHENHDYMCILTLNNLNEKIYIFLWFWFILLSFASLLSFAYNIAVLVSPKFRKRELRQYCVLSAIEKSRINELVRKTQIGDFFLWELMGRNMSSKCYSIFINELYENLLENKKLMRLDPEEEYMNGKQITPDSAETLRLRTLPSFK